MTKIRNHNDCTHGTNEEDTAADPDTVCPGCGARPEPPDQGEPPAVSDPIAANKIAVLNDAFRNGFGGGKVMLSASVAALPDMVKADALHRVAIYDAFTPDNDPYGEHDFGSFELVSREFFWKIDYYDPTMQFGSEDPADTTKTLRVLTLMLAQDY